MARRVRPAERSIASSAVSLPLYSNVFVDIHHDPLPQSGILVPEPLIEPAPLIVELPIYDAVRRELWFMRMLIKRLRSDAHNQIRCFRCYHEQAWQGPLFDPLSPNGLSDPHKRFLDTVEGMNERHANPGWLQFVPDGCEKVLWAPGPEAIALAASRRTAGGVRLNVVGVS